MSGPTSILTDGEGSNEFQRLIVARRSLAQ
jgi:hypothetical protein